MPITTQITTSATMLWQSGESIRFLGLSDRLSFGYAAGHDTVMAQGSNQTISMSRSSSNTIYDQGHGLKLEFGAPTIHDTVIGFQNDLTGTLAFGGPVTFASDHHGGTMVTGNYISVDFVGFRDAHALEARIRPFT